MHRSRYLVGVGEQEVRRVCAGEASLHAVLVAVLYRVNYGWNEKALVKAQVDCED